MGTDERSPVGALITALLQRPQGFNLFQAISLLERAEPEAVPLGEGATQKEAVRLKAVVSLGFQPSDVSSVKVGAESGEAYTLATPVLSLAGAQGPLPLPFTELVLERKAVRDHATADFLDIFNHRFLAFLYRSRKKHHIGLNWRSPQFSTLGGCLDSLSSLGIAAGIRGPQGQTAWLRHAGLHGGAPRSIAGLLALLGDRFGLTVRATQFRGGWHEIDTSDLSQLRGKQTSKSPRLGRSAVLGRRFWDQSAGIELEFSGLSAERLDQLLPSGDSFELLQWMILRYLQQEMGVVLALRPNPKEIPQTVIGGRAPLRLGWTSWLRSGVAGTVAFPPARLQLMNGALRAPA